MKPEQYKILRENLADMSDENQADILRQMSDIDYLGLLNYIYLN